MAIFKRWKLKDNGAAEYRQEGSTVSMRCSEGLWDGEAPMEIEVRAPNLAAVPEPKAKGKKADTSITKAAGRAAKGPKTAKKGSAK